MADLIWIKFIANNYKNEIRALWFSKQNTIGVYELSKNIQMLGTKFSITFYLVFIMEICHRLLLLLIMFIRHVVKLFSF